MVFALALTSQLAEGFLVPTGVGKQVEARTGQVSCLLGRRQVATSAALLALGSYAGEAQAIGTKLSLEEQRELAGLGPIRKADQSKIGVSSVPIPTVGKTNSEPNIKGPVDTSGWKKCESKGVLGCWAEYSPIFGSMGVVGRYPRSLADL